MEIHLFELVGEQIVHKTREFLLDSLHYQLFLIQITRVYVRTSGFNIKDFNLTN